MPKRPNDKWMRYLLVIILGRSRKRGPRVWQGFLVIFLSLMIILNLRILLTTDTTGASRFVKDLRSKSLCERPLVINVKDKADVVPLNKSFALVKWLDLHEGHAKVIGSRRDKPGFLTIGVPSVKRLNGMSYLVQTLSSLVNRTSTEDKMSVIIVVFLGDTDTEYNSEVVATLMDKFVEYINMGFIQIIQVPKDFYPTLTGLKQNYNDSAERVTWRAKQVVDFTFMFLYSQNLSEYYMQIEDDVICANGFVTAIREYIYVKSKEYWVLLEFSELGFIGKLFKSTDLTKLARYMLTFYDEQPVDWLITYFRLSMVQRNINMRKPTLFQHIGLKSSFSNNNNKLKDNFFVSGEKSWKSDDPPGVVITNMKPYEQYMPKLAYGSGSGFFWAKDVQPGNWIAIVFYDDVLLQRVVVETGHPDTFIDRLVNGTLEVSPKLLKIDRANNEVICAEFQTLGQFESGHIDIQNLNIVLEHTTTKCLRILIDAEQKNWVVFNQIAVFVDM